MEGLEEAAPGRPLPLLELLAGIACGAPRGRLVPLWRAEAARDGGEAVVRAAVQYGLISAAGMFAENLDREDLTPAARALVLGGMRARAAVRRHLEVLARLDARPEMASVGGIVVKGGALVLAGCYPDGAREFCDVDVLVPARALGAVEAAAREAGLSFVPQDPDRHDVAGVCDADGFGLDIHVGLGDPAGKGRGLPWEAVDALARTPPPETGLKALRLLRGQAAREIAVLHFLRNGLDPGIVLRVLQDLTRLEGEPVGGPLTLPEAERRKVNAVLSTLRKEASALAGGEAAERGSPFVVAMAAVPTQGERGGAASQSDFFDRWLSDSGGPFSAALRMAAHLVRPPRGVSVVSRLRRVPEVLGRYAKGKLERRRNADAEKAIKRWRRFLEGTSE